MKSKEYFVYVNFWTCLLYLLAFVQVYYYFSEGRTLWDTVVSIVLLWALFMIGYNAHDRELEIDLDKAKRAIAENMGV